MSASRRFIVLVAGVLTMLPAVAAAQLSTAGFPIDIGQTVWVTAADGRVTKGKVLNLTPSTIEIGEGEVATANLAIADVRRIQVPDSVADGVVKGALTGGLVGFLVGGVFDAGAAIGDAFAAGLVGLLGAEMEPVRRSSRSTTGALIGVAFGAAVGFAIDDGKAKTIYERKDGGMTVSVRPISSAAGTGVGVRVRW